MLTYLYDCGIYDTMGTVLIRINKQTKARLEALSLTRDADGKPNETMDSIVRRSLDALEQKTQKKTIDVSRL